MGADREQKVVWGGVNFDLFGGLCRGTRNTVHACLYGELQTCTAQQGVVEGEERARAM